MNCWTLSVIPKSSHARKKPPPPHNHHHHPSSLNHSSRKCFTQWTPVLIPSFLLVICSHFYCLLLFFFCFAFFIFAGPGNTGAGRYGDYRNCDTPTWTLEGLFTHLSQQKVLLVSWLVLWAQSTTAEGTVYLVSIVVVHHNRWTSLGVRKSDWAQVWWDVYELLVDRIYTFFCLFLNCMKKESMCINECLSFFLAMRLSCFGWQN